MLISTRVVHVLCGNTEDQFIVSPNSEVNVVLALDLLLKNEEKLIFKDVPFLKSAYF